MNIKIGVVIQASDLLHHVHTHLSQEHYVRYLGYFNK